MAPYTGMAELWGTLDLAGIMKSSACDFMRVKQFLPDNMGPISSEGLYLQCLHEEFSLQLHGLGAVPAEIGLQLLELGAVPTGYVKTWHQSVEDLHLQCLPEVT